MKNFKLLLASTAILSTGALMVNAGTHTPTIYASAFLMNPVTISSSAGDALDFGHVYFEKGKTIIIDAAGEFDSANSTGHIIEGVHTSAAHFVLTGGYIGYAGTTSESGTDMTDTVKNNFQWNVPSFNVTSDNKTCGRVDVNVDEISYKTSSNGLDIYLGGTFTMADSDIVTATGLLCKGSAIATIIYPEYSIEE